MLIFHPFFLELVSFINWLIGKVRSFLRWILDWFKPLAYALILLRKHGLPCVFYGDYYGIPSQNVNPMKDGGLGDNKGGAPQKDSLEKSDKTEEVQDYTQWKE